MSALTLIRPPTVEQLAEVAVATLPSAISRGSYKGYLRRYLEWSRDRQFTREAVGMYLGQLRTAGASQSVLRQNIKAIRLLAKECKYRGLLTDREYEGIAALRVAGSDSFRSGNWLSIEDVRALLRLPDKATLDGLQHAVVLGLMVGCGLRRAEAATVTWAHYQMRDGRRCLVDFTGKGNKTRIVPVPDWLAADMDKWHKQFAAPEIAAMGRVNIWYVVKRYVSQLAAMPGYAHVGGVGPHDLRRTLAKLMHKAQVPLDQITATLGHSDLRMTQRYLGLSMELKAGKAGVDMVDMRGESNGSDS